MLHVTVNVTYSIGKARDMGSEVGYKNLVVPPKGTTPNPNGRPKGLKNGLRATLRAALRRNPNANVLDLLKVKGVDVAALSGKTVAEGLTDVLVAMGLEGNMDAIKLKFAQTEKPLERGADVIGNSYLLGLSEAQAIELLTRRGNVLLPDARAALIDLRPGDEAIEAEAIEVESGESAGEMAADPDYCI